jgi:uncharacterized membrane protein
MDGLPSLWRPELYHPMAVHFPIVLLMTGTVFWLLGSIEYQNQRWGFLRPSGQLLLAAGAVSVWVAVYTGDMADAEVVRSLCDPTVVEEHEELAYVVGYIFTGTVALDLARARISGLQKWSQWFGGLIGVALIAGSVLLGYVGHLGASLVYQQGAGVYHPSETCEEFE